MSLDAMMWAVKDAPTKDVYEHAVLTVMADEADEAGCGVFLSVPTIAERARCDAREVRRCLADMEARKLIGRGNQALASYIRADRRPVVYDLLIPFSSYSPAAIERVNKARAGREQPPMTSDSRPDIAAPPPKARRSDLGKPRQKRPDGVTTSPIADGVTTSPAGLVNGHGVTDNSPRGDYQSPDPVINPVSRNPLSGQPSVDRRVAEQTSIDLDEPADDAPPPERVPTPKDVAFGAARSWLARRQDDGVPVIKRGRTDPLHALVAVVEPALLAGYSETEVKWALVLADKGIPSVAQLDAALAGVRRGEHHDRGRYRTKARTGPMTGINRHVDSLTVEERHANNPFALAITSGGDDERGAA